ncbi:hypothetical protein AB4559_18065 [Vibrio sp. 10N.222.51.C8]|uniref:hypothetical protein n=1 Tax=Vibrio sp. 10N.222.51.C8 TaxID=3229624 RepID=UPI0035505720
MTIKSNDVKEAKSFGFSSIKEFRRTRTLIGSLIVETRKNNKKAACKLYKLLQDKPDLKLLCEHLIQMPNLDAYKSKASVKDFAMFRGHKKMDSIRVIKAGGAPGLGKKS